MPGQGLLALQGPQAAAALERLLPGAGQLVFMSGSGFDWNGVPLFITRSGYTGEDGFEISVPGAQAEQFARALLAQPEVKPIGLGARNSLRLEAGLCLYGNDIDATTTPPEAALNWAIQKVRRTGGTRRRLSRRGQGAGADRRPGQPRAQARGPDRQGARARARAGDAGEPGRPAHRPVTSGLLSPSLNQPIALAYVQPDYAEAGTELFAMVRGKPVPMVVAPTPFLPPRYHRG